MVLLMAIACLFGVPAYYLAKSKGRSGRGYGMATLLSGLSVIALGIFGLVLPAAMLGALYLLPALPGAPGKTYLKIVFPCPECDKVVTFPRHREGMATLCPECGELIRVPEDEYSPHAAVPDRVKPSQAQGEICFESFGHPEPAYLFAAFLNDQGVRAHVVEANAGGFLPHVGNTEGFKILIDIAQWDDAVEIEKQSQQDHRQPL